MQFAGHVKARRSLGGPPELALLFEKQETIYVNERTSEDWGVYREGEIHIMDMPTPREGPTGGDGPVAPRALIRKLSVLGNLELEDIAFIEAIQAERKRYAKGREIVRLGDRYTAVLVMCEGWAYRCHTFSNGRRQILGFALPGDFIALHVNFPRTSDHSVVAITDATIAMIPVAKIEEIHRDRPRLAAALSYSTAQDHTLLGAHIARLGRRDSYERMAHFFLELRERLGLVNGTASDSFELPLTQEELGDLLGLTVVHVNRTLRRLESSGLIVRERRRVKIADLAGLNALADYESVGAGIVSAHRDS